MIRYIVFVLLIAGLSACGEKDAYPLKSKFIFVNAAPNSPDLHVFVDGNALDITPLSFPNHDSIYLIAGKRDLKIGPTLSELFFDSTLYLVENRAYSIYFLNTLNKIDTVLRRDTLTLPAINKAKIRFIHLSPDVSAVNFTAYAQTATLELNNQPYKNFPAFAEVDARNYKIGASINNNGGSVNLPDSIALETGKIYTVYLHGLSTSPAGSPQALGLSIIENN